MEKQSRDTENAKQSEKDQWVRPALRPALAERAEACVSFEQAELMRISRINFSEAVELLVHLKIIRAYVESVLRYGLPAAYFYVIIKVSPS